MPYQFALNLCGSLCSECHEPLAFVDVLLVAPRRQTDLIVAAVAEPKNTVTILDPEAFSSLQDRIIAKGSTDAEGKLAINIADERYQGGAFEVVLAISAVPQQKRQQDQELLPVSLTTLQPQWQQKEGFFLRWLALLPARQDLVCHPGPFRCLGDLRPGGGSGQRHRGRRRDRGGL